MKRFNILLVLFLTASAAFGQENVPQDETESAIQVQQAIFGTATTEEGSLGNSEMLERYQGLSQNDSISVKFKGTVQEVCQAKGCWMKVALADGQNVMVRFKDYAFFVPKDIAGKEVVVQGLAYTDVLSVEDRRHYAKDAGKSDKEIEAIQEPQKTFGFRADGVLVKE